MKVAELLSILQEIAPFETAEAWDNVGLLIGHRNAEVRGIHVALDATLPEIGAMGGANVLLTHHPLLFSPLRRLDFSEPEHAVVAECIKRDTALIAMHTNWDKAPGGVSDTLAGVLGLQNIIAVNDFLRVGDLAAPMSARDFAGYLARKLDSGQDFGHNAERSIARVAVAPGAGGAECLLAAEAGADALVAGEIKHNHLLDCHALGLAAFVCGHYETEQPAMPVLAESLQKRLHGLQYNVGISVGRGFAGGRANSAI